MQRSLLVILGVIFLSCNQGKDFDKVKEGMTRSQVMAILGTAEKQVDGWEMMTWTGPDSTGTAEFKRINENRYETWEYKEFRYDSLKCKGPIYIIDNLHKLEIKQPTDVLHRMLQYQVIFDRTTGRVVENGFRPILFRDRVNGDVSIMATMKKYVRK